MSNTFSNENQSGVTDWNIFERQTKTNNRDFGLRVGGKAKSRYKTLQYVIKIKLNSGTVK